METPPQSDETPEEETLDPSVGKLINMVLLAPERHKAMLERLRKKPLRMDMSKFEPFVADQENESPSEDPKPDF